MTEVTKKMKLTFPWHFPGVFWNAGDVVEVLGDFPMWPGFVNTRSEKGQYCMLPLAFLADV